MSVRARLSDDGVAPYHKHDSGQGGDKWFVVFVFKKEWVKKTQQNVHSNRHGRKRLQGIQNAIWHESSLKMRNYDLLSMAVICKSMRSSC